jgi:hypothetical protein
MRGNNCHEIFMKARSILTARLQQRRLEIFWLPFNKCAKKFFFLSYIQEAQFLIRFAVANYMSSDLYMSSGALPVLSGNGL